MHEDWIIAPDADGGGTIEHRAAPRFRARWQTGLDALANLEGLCWTSEASGEEDAITFYALTWHDAPPGQSAFEALMQEAAAALDAWIARRF
jgi:hypothetical protein